MASSAAQHGVSARADQLASPPRSPPALGGVAGGAAEAAGRLLEVVRVDPPCATSSNQGGGRVVSSHKVFGATAAPLPSACLLVNEQLGVAAQTCPELACCSSVLLLCAHTKPMHVLLPDTSCWMTTHRSQHRCSRGWLLRCCSPWTLQTDRPGVPGALLQAAC